MDEDDLFGLIVCFITICGMIALVVIMAFSFRLAIDQRVKYDCSISEFSPDFNQRMKEQCKKK